MIAGPVPKQHAWNKAWFATPRLLRFFAVGGLNTLFGYGAYAALLFVGFHYAWAALLATIAGVTFNYFTTGRLVFDHMSRSRLLRFVGVYFVTYLINVAALAVLEHFGVGAYVAGLVMIVPMAFVSFLLMKHFVFRSERVAH
jgi:putative flippase GtrA